MGFNFQDAFGWPLEVEKDKVSNDFEILDTLTSREKLPRLFQVETALSIIMGDHTVVRAGTGAGKTLAMALAMLLRQEWIFITVAPLLALHKQHVCFNCTVLLFYFTLYLLAQCLYAQYITILTNDL